MASVSDALTGLPDRTLLVDRLQQAMGQALRQRKRVALVLLNLDGFDDVNRKFGRGIGDRLLVHVAGALKSSLRGTDTICRYRDAEFVLMLPEVDDIDYVNSVVRKVRVNLAESLLVEDPPASVTVCIGLALYPGDGRDCVELLNRADVAMDRDKTTRNSPATACS